MNRIQVKQYLLQIPSVSIMIGNFHDFGDKMTEEFKLLYHGFFTSGRLQLTDNFIKTSYSLLEKFDDKNKTSLSDDYFENFTAITEKLLETGQYKLTFDLWNRILTFIKEWEKTSGKSLHKGTPYYFAAVSAILGRDFDSGIISMHLALEEDKLNHADYKNAPGYWFLTLNDARPTQYFKLFVDGMVSFLRDRLDGQGSEQGKYKDHYQGTRNGQLTYNRFRQKFLDDINKSEDLKFYFVYSIIRIWHLRINQQLARDEKIISSVIFIQSLGQLLIMIEMLLKMKYPKPASHRRPWSFANIFEKLAHDESWEINIKEIQDKRDNNFSSWMDECLNRNSLKEDFTLAYGLRNFTFHKIESQQKLWQEFTRIFQSMCNCLFKSIEII